MKLEYLMILFCATVDCAPAASTENHLVEWLQAINRASDTKLWIEPALSPRTEWVELPSSRFFEVAASKRDAAMYGLHDVLSPLDGEGSTAYFGNRGFVCEEPNKAYLVRALYTNGGTGGFAPYMAGRSLIVEHGSLGGGSELEHTALVVCLAEKPEGVYSSIANAL